MFQAVEHQCADFPSRRTWRRGWSLTRQQDEQDRRKCRRAAVDQLNGRDGHCFGQDRRQHHAEGRADQIRQRDQSHRGGTLFEGEPIGGDFRPRVEQERLRGGDADGAPQDERVIRARQPAQDAEDAHQHTADADRQAEAVGIDHPRNGNRQRDEGDHERHRQQADLQIGHAVIGSGGACDRCVRDPQGLDGEVDEHEDSQHHPAVGIQFVLIGHEGSIF